MKAIVDYKTLQDGNIIAVCANQEATMVSAQHVHDYMKRMMDVTNAPDVEFSKTFEQAVNGKVYYAFQREYSHEAAPIFKVVVLDNNTLAAKFPGEDTIQIIEPEDGDQVFATAADAKEASKQYALQVINADLDELVAVRKITKEYIHTINSDIDAAIAARKKLSK